MEENEIVGISDLIKAKVFDVDGTRVGHLHDLSIPEDIKSPTVNGVGVHLSWTEKVGEVELVRPVEDIVYLVPWTHIREFDMDELRLDGKHPDFPLMSAEKLLLVRRDILNKQMIDRRKKRIQRVDDVMIAVEKDGLKIVGLEVSGTFMLASPRLKRFIQKTKKKYGRSSDIDMVPWKAVKSVEPEHIVLNEDFSLE